MYKKIGLILIVLFLAQAVIALGPAAVNLGSAGGFAILAKSGISTTGTTAVVGNIGASPIDSTGITGFGLVMHSSNQFATSSLVLGKVFASNYSPPTPTNMTNAVSDMETAYTDAAGRTNPIATELGAGNIGGMTLAPGVYKWSTGVTIPTNLTLSGGKNAVWIFQIAQNLDVGNGVSVNLAGGAKAQNVFWQVAGQATLGTTSSMAGTILSQTAIVMNTGSNLDGRALAQTAVTLDAGTVTSSNASSGMETLLNVDMDINGSSTHAGDTFQVHVTVENIGTIAAINVKGDLRNTPDSWSVSPFTYNGSNHSTGSYDFGTLAPGEIKSVDYTVTRDANEPGPIIQNGGIWYRAFADNAPVAEGSDINVPISPIVLTVLSIGMIGSALYLRKK